ncbi:hypothetical protein HYW59_03130 [Candidatus Kaiserbacteria bacterium]|nr:hypothetical protein [Candidatus Kaiserbacteria bacterium]
MLYRIANNARPLLAALGFLGAVLLPPWVPLLVMVLLAFRFAAWEIPAIGLFVDLIWLAPSGEGLLASLPLFTLAGLALMWGLEPLRSEFLTR